MMNLTYLLLFLIIALILLFAWNAINFRQFKNQTINTNLNDAKYWELKFKFEFLVATFILVGSVISFLGFNSISSIRNEVALVTKSKVDSVVTAFNVKYDSVQQKLYKAQSSVLILSGQVDQTSATLNKDKKQFDKYKIDQKLLLANSKLSHTELDTLNSQLSQIKNKAILKQPFYFISNHKFRVTDIGNYITISFNDLKTANGLPLPEFKKPPLIVFSPSENTSAILIKTFKDKFEFINHAEGMTDDEIAKTIFNVSFLIIEVPE